LSFLDRLIPSRKAEPNDVVVSSVLNATTQTGTAFPDASYSNFAREGYAGNELVFACIREIATSSSEAFLRYYDRDGEIVETSPVSNLINRPAPGLTQYEFLENLITHLHIAGNAYVLKERARVGIVSLLLLRPDRIEVLPGRGYQYDINGSRYIIPAEDIGHLKFPNPNNDYYGLSPLQVLAKQVNLDSDATKFTKAFFTNAGVPSGILKLKRKLSSQDEASKLRAAWRGHFQGTRNWHRIAILDEDASYETMGSGIGDMEIPSLRALSETRICSALGVPAILVGANVGLQRSTYSNYGEARESFWEETLLPMYRRVEQFISELLLPEFPSEQGRIAFDFSEVRALQEDETATVGRQLVRAQITKEFINAGFTPAAALSAAGIDTELEHTGFLPTTLAVRGLQAAEIKGEQKVLTQAAANRILGPLAESYEEETETMERVLEKFFRAQLNRADGIMGRYLSDGEIEEKIQMPFNEITLLPLVADAELTAAMSPTLLSAMGKAWNIINTVGVFREMPFDPELPIVSNTLRRAGTKINDVSRAALRSEIQTGTRAGYSLDQIVRGVPKDEYRGLRKIVRETYKNRAKTIARTEIATAQNTATAARYKAAGVAHVIVQDGDEDELCAPFSGTTQTIDWALDNPIAHPNCTRAYSAIIDGVTE
jgi:HK97 family phage portal protein